MSSIASLWLVEPEAQATVRALTNKDNLLALIPHSSKEHPINNRLLCFFGQEIIHPLILLV
jgi:hypothetical protein